MADYFNCGPACFRCDAFLYHKQAQETLANTGVTGYPGGARVSGMKNL